MGKIPDSIVVQGHPDHELLAGIAEEIGERLGMRPDEGFSELIVQAIEFVLDPVRTGRTSIAQLDNVEKTFIGLKVEHFLRDLLDAPKGIRDLVLSGHDVDVKNTVSRSWAWMIPPETYRSEEPVLLIAADEEQRKAWMGVFKARDAYLGRPNRDGKRGVLVSAYENILWLAPGLDWPANRWKGLNMARFRELRSLKGGARRAAIFFEENLNRVTDRSVIVALLFDQLDPMKRLRGNGGARDLLKPKGIALLSGKYDRDLLSRLGHSLTNDEHIAIAPQNAEEERLLRAAGKIA